LLVHGGPVDCSISPNASSAVELVILLKLGRARKLCRIFQLHMVQ